MFASTGLLAPTLLPATRSAPTSLLPAAAGGAPAAGLAAPVSSLLPTGLLAPAAGSTSLLPARLAAPTTLLPTGLTIATRLLAPTARIPALTRLAAVGLAAVPVATISGLATVGFAAISLAPVPIFAGSISRIVRGILNPIPVGLHRPLLGIMVHAPEVGGDQRHPRRQHRR